MLLFLVGGKGVSAADLPADYRVEFLEGPVFSTKQNWATLKWKLTTSVPFQAEYEVQRSKRADFSDAKTVYRGPDAEYLASGVPEGKTWFRVRLFSVKEGQFSFGPWSAPLTFEVNQGEAPKLIAVAFENDPVVRTDQGFIQLKWKPLTETSEPITYYLEQSRDGIYSSPLHEERNLYRGPDRASFVPGLPEGKTHFRVCAQVGGNPLGPWSDDVIVEVKYESESFVLTWLIVGAVVFFVTVLTVVVGHLRTKQETTP